jgi:regulator of sigma D
LAVDFNEKYETLEEEGFLKTLSKDLSALGEVLATRIELEDRLIRAMLGDPPDPK